MAVIFGLEWGCLKQHRRIPMEGRDGEIVVHRILEAIWWFNLPPSVGVESCMINVYNNLIWWFSTLPDLTSHFYNVFMMSSLIFWNEIAKCEITSTVYKKKIHIHSTNCNIS